jgi:hypothetical protein
MNPLEQLKDIHLPGAVSAWPPSIAWWLALLLALITCVLLIFAGLYYRKRSRLTRLALAELARLQQQGCDINALHLLLKRVVLTSFPRQQVAALYGQQWLEFLDQQAGKKTKNLIDFMSNADAWTDNLYCAKAPETATDMHFQTCRAWLKKTTLMPVEHN